MKPDAYWPWAITAFFVVFIACMVTFVLFTTRHRVHLVAPDYYEQEVAYQSRIDSERRARALGDKVRVSYQPQRDLVRIQFEPSSVTSPVSGEILLYRPSDAAQDRSVGLALDRDGGQSIPTGALLSGLWRVRMSWTMAGEEHYVEEVIVVD